MTAPGLDLAAVKARIAGATEGPWDAPEMDGNPVFASDDECIGDDFDKRADAEFIAHARTDMPALVDLLEQTEREVERLRAREKVFADFDSLHDHLLALNEQGIPPDVSGYDKNGSPIVAWLTEEGGDATYPLALTLGGEDAAQPEPDRHDAAALAYPVLILDTSVAKDPS